MAIRQNMPILWIVILAIYIGTCLVKSTVCHLRVGDGSLTDSDKEAADTLCTYFHKVFSSDDAQSMILNEPNQVELSITFDTHVVLQKLQQLKADKSQDQVVFTQRF